MSGDLPKPGDFGVAFRAAIDAKDAEIAKLTRELEAYRAAARTAAKVTGRRGATPKPEVSAPPRETETLRGLRSMARDMSMGRGETAVLTAIAQHREAGVTREQLTVLTGYKRSSRDTYVQRLVALALVEKRGDGSLRATPAGVAKLGPSFAPLPTGAALLAHWMMRLPAGEKVVLDAIVRQYPASVSREDLSAWTGYKRSSRDTYIQRLIARKLVERAAMVGELRASAMLFDDGRSRRGR